MIGGVFASGAGSLLFETDRVGFVESESGFSALYTALSPFTLTAFGQRDTEDRRAAE